MDDDTSLTVSAIREVVTSRIHGWAICGGSGVCGDGITVAPIVEAIVLLKDDSMAVAYRWMKTNQWMTECPELVSVYPYSEEA